MAMPGAFSLSRGMRYLNNSYHRAQRLVATAARNCSDKRAGWRFRTRLSAAGQA